jgi:outer membrane protein TolC
MKLRIYLLGLLLVTTESFAQLTLQDCHQKAHDNYPLIKQYQLVEETQEYNIDNAAKGYLPQVSVTGMAVYHTNMLKTSIPNMDLKNTLYGGMISVSQNIYDGGDIASHKRLSEASGNVNKAELNVSMYDINHRVEQLFFSVLLIDEEIKQNGLLQSDLALSRKSVEGMMKNGIANQSDVDAIHVEQLNALQNEKSLKLQRQYYLSMLGLFIHEKLSDDTTLQSPNAEIPVDLEVKRPELQQFESLVALQNEREKALDVNLKPKLGLFATGLFGNSGLDMLHKQSLMAGVKVSWNIGALYTRKNDKRIIEMNRQQIASNRETFLFNTRLQTTNENMVINDIKEKIKTDDDIIALRTNIRSKAERKVENGTLTVNEMLRQINAESEAKQSKALHNVQLLKEIYQLKNIGNY